MIKVDLEEVLALLEEMEDQQVSKLFHRQPQQEEWHLTEHIGYMKGVRGARKRVEVHYKREAIQ